MMARSLTILIGCVTLPGVVCEDATIMDNIVGPGPLPEVSTLLAALTAADLVDTLSDVSALYTVFAPTNAAFAAIEPNNTVTDLMKAENKADLVKVLTYHVVIGKFMAAQLSAGTDLATVLTGGKLSVAIAGDNVTIGGVAKVAMADVEASNGVVHLINAVLLPPKNIVQLAEATPDLSTLVAALTAADYVDPLSGPGTYTVFAPTNAAFAAMGDTVTDLMKAENLVDLVRLLASHVVYGSNMAADLSDGTDLVTLSGVKLSVAAGDTITIGGVAKVATADLNAFNGVVHIIDAVLVPPNIVPSTTSMSSGVTSTAVTSTRSDNVTSAAHAVSIVIAVATTMICVFER